MKYIKNFITSIILILIIGCINPFAGSNFIKKNKHSHKKNKHSNLNNSNFKIGINQEIINSNNINNIFHIGEELVFFVIGDIMDNYIYRWDFGDGYYLTNGKPHSLSNDGGSCVSHYFRKVGDFKVKLTVITSDNSYNISRDITITGSSSGNLFDFIHSGFECRITQDLIIKINSNASGASRITVNFENGAFSDTAINESVGPGSVIRKSYNTGNLPPGNYIVKASLYNGSTIIDEIWETFTKSSSGIPHIGINGNNAICINGKPFFPITGYLLNKEYFASWSNYYANAGVAEGWYTTHNTGTWSDYLNSAGNNNLYIIGPLRWDGIGQNYSYERNSNIFKLKNYIEYTKNYNSLLGWTWDEETNMGGRDLYTPPQVVRGWTKISHLLDPDHPTATILYGWDYLPYYENRLTGTNSYLFSGYFPMYNAEHFGGRTGLITDIIGFDIYPIEFQDHPSLLQNRQFEQYIEAVKNIHKYTYDLVPFIPCIETTDIGEHGSFPGPTPSQLKMMIWLNIVHGAEGIQWFHYRTVTPPENYVVMNESYKLITELTDVILSKKPGSLNVSDNANVYGNRVDTMIREYNGTIWLIAVRITELNELGAAPINVNFNITGGSGTIEVYNEGRILAGSNSFTDSFAPCDVHIYKIY